MLAAIIAQDLIIPNVLNAHPATININQFATLAQRDISQVLVPALCALQDAQNAHYSNPLFAQNALMATD